MYNDGKDDVSDWGNSSNLLKTSSSFPLQQKCDFGKLQVYSASVFRVTNNGFES
jgi:hypothetical protein